MITTDKTMKRAWEMIKNGDINPRFNEHSENMRYGRDMYNFNFGTVIGQNNWCWRYVYSLEELNALQAGEDIDIDYTHIMPVFVDEYANYIQEVF